MPTALETVRSFARVIAPVLIVVLVAPPAFAQETRTLTDALNREVAVPADPQRIVAIRHDAIATPLLDLGAPVVGTIGQTHALTDEVFIRGATDILGINFGEESGITNVGGSSGIDIETITRLDPDLIITWDSDQVDQLAIIAPTFVIPEGLPHFEHLELLADLAGVSDTYDRRLAAYRAKIAAIRQKLGDPSRITLSRPQLRVDLVGYYLNWGALDRVIADIGFSVPEPLATQTDIWGSYSIERLQDFDADLMLSGYADHFDQTVTSFTEEWDAKIPFWRNLSAVQSGNFFWYPRDVWHGYTFKSLEIAADSLLLLTAGRFPDTR